MLANSMPRTPTGSHFTLPSRMPEIRLACISTPGNTLETGVTRRSMMPGAVEPISTMRPSRLAEGTRSWITSPAET